VKTPQHRHFASLIAVATLTFAAGCHKKAVATPTAAPRRLLLRPHRRLRSL